MEAIYNYNDRGNLVSKITMFGKGECTNTVMEYDDKDRVIRQVVYNYDFFNKKNKDIEDETIITYENDVIVSILNNEGLRLREYNKDIETDRFGTISFDFVQTNKIEDKINSLYCETKRNGIYHVDEENIDVEYDKISYNIDYCDNGIVQSLVLYKDDFTVYLENSYNGEKKNYRITKYNDDKLLESDITVDIVSNQKRYYSCKNKYIASLDELDDNDIDIKIDNSDIIEDESIDIKSIDNNYTIKYMTDNETEIRNVIAESTIKGFDKTDNNYFILHKTNSNNETFGKIERRYDIHNRLIQSSVNNIISIYEYQSDTDDRIKTHTTIGGLRKFIKTKDDGVKLTKENKKKDIYLYNEYNDKLITVKYTISYLNQYCSKSIKITDKDSRIYYESEETSMADPLIANEVLALTLDK